MSENIEIIIAELEKESEDKLFFAQQNLGAEVHWFFIQRFQALKKTTLYTRLYEFSVWN